MGLIPTLRRVWGRRGCRPTASSRRTYKWRYVFGFVHPSSGSTDFFITSTVSTKGMNQVLAAFAKNVGVGPSLQVVLVMDGAGWHVGKDLAVPDGIHLVIQPPYSPEVQPSERLWPLINEAIANRDFTSLADHEAEVGKRCVYLTDNPQMVKGPTGFGWWPQDVQPERAPT